jgi:hypothetical protein
LAVAVVKDRVADHNAAFGVDHSNTSFGRWSQGFGPRLLS